MPGALGPRFALEAGFLILLAVVLGFADLTPLLIILIMALAWVLVSLIEYFAWRQGPRFPTRYAAALGPDIEQESIVVEEPVPVVPPPPVARREPSPPPAEEETMAAPPPPPDSPLTEEQQDAADKEERLAFAKQEASRTIHRLEPLQPRPRRRFGIFGPRSRPESPREEER